MANPVNRMLWVVMIVSQVAYVGVAALVKLPPRAELVATLEPVFAALAGAIAVGSVVLRRRALEEPIRSGALDLATPEGLARATSLYIVGLTLSEAVGILGLLLALLSGSLEPMLPFGVGALALLWLHRPTSPALVPPLGGHRTAPPIG